MKRSIFKPIIFGVLFGTAVFFMPFIILKCIFFFMFIGAIFRFFAWRRFRYAGMNYHVIYADKIRNMSEEEYSEFKNKTQNCYHHYKGCNNYSCKTEKPESNSNSDKNN